MTGPAIPPESATPPSSASSPGASADLRPGSPGASKPASAGAKVGRPRAPFNADPARHLVGGQPSSVIVPARLAGDLVRAVTNGARVADVAALWARTDPEAAAVLTALASAAMQAAQRNTRCAGCGTSEHASAPTMTPSSAMLTTDQAADRLGCGPRNVRALLARGRIHAEMIGGRWMYPAGEIAAFKESR